MSKRKKQIRAAFRSDVFKRDQYRCKFCGFQSSAATAAEELDAHHIVSRKEAPHGGYVKENGIALCKVSPNYCHAKIEAGLVAEEELFRKIGSSHQKAVAASQRLS